MPCQLASALGFLKQRGATSSFGIPFKEDMTNEVSEHEGILLVRLRGGSAMQVRLETDSNTVLTRTVPIAKATQVQGDSPWLVASDSEVRTWIRPDSAIWRWLQAKGIDGGKLTERLAESARPAFLALRPKSSLSLP